MKKFFMFLALILYISMHIVKGAVDPDMPMDWSPHLVRWRPFSAIPRVINKRTRSLLGLVAVIVAMLGVVSTGTTAAIGTDAEDADAEDAETGGIGRTFTGIEIFDNRWR